MRWPNGCASGRGMSPLYGYRYYHPFLGRWVSRDPLGRVGHETVKLLHDHGEFAYQQELKADLDYYSVILLNRWNQAHDSELNADEFYELNDEAQYVKQINSYLKARNPRGFDLGVDYLFVLNNSSNLIDDLGELPWETGPSGSRYRPDPTGHGVHPDGTPIDSHVDRKTKGGTKYRYDLDGTPRKGAPSIPEKDRPFFKKIASKGLKFGTKKMPIIGWDLAAHGTYKGCKEGGFWGSVSGALW